MKLEKDKSELDNEDEAAAPTEEDKERYRRAFYDKVGERYQDLEGRTAAK